MGGGVVTPSLKVGAQAPIHEDGERMLRAMDATTHTEDAEQTATDSPAARPERVRTLVVATALAAIAVSALVFDPSVVPHAPVVFGLLVVSFVVLDVVRIDLFERAHISPASVPALALACTFGPIGPIVAESALALRRATKRDPIVRWTFDWGSLGLAGMAAALTFAALPHGSPAAVAMSALVA